MSAAAPLIFTWTPPRRRARALTALLIVSALLHALCFYVFQIVYPPVVTLAPAPARVSLISGDNPATEPLLRWIEAEDPALTTTTQRPAETKTFALPAIEHTPSYVIHRPQLRELPPTSPPLDIPSMALPGAVRSARLPAVAMTGVRKTTVEFSGTAAALGTPVFPDYSFHLTRAEAPANPTFRIAMDDKGAVHHCFLVESSGDAALDEQAREFLLRCRFAKKNDHATPDLIWGIATVLWGNDLSASPTASPTASTP